MLGHRRRRWPNIKPALVEWIGLLGSPAALIWLSAATIGSIPLSAETVFVSVLVSGFLRVGTEGRNRPGSGLSRYS